MPIAELEMTYELRLTVKRPVERDHDATPAEAAAFMDGYKERRALERDVLIALRKIAGDCDCEVMKTTTEEA